MHSPRHSFGESRAQPSTPISASGECGGSRSSPSGRPPLGEASRFRRAFFKSAGAPPVAPCKGSETESIIAHSITAGKHLPQDKVVFLFHKVIRQKKIPSPPRPAATGASTAGRGE